MARIGKDFTRDLKKWREVPFGNTSNTNRGKCIELKERLDLYSYIRRTLNGVFDYDISAPIPYPKPIGLHTGHLKDISSNSESYLLTEKSDGERFLLFFLASLDYQTDLIAFIDGRYNIRLVEYQAPRVIFEGTLLDGELIRSVDSEQPWKFLVFDIYLVCGTPVHHNYRLRDRLKLLHNVLPFIFPLETSPFLLYEKSYCSVKDIKTLTTALRESNSMRDGIDGIIVNQDTRVKPFTSDNVFKYKMFRDATVDFRIRIQGTTLHFYARDDKVEGEPYFRLELRHLSDCQPATSSSPVTFSEFACHAVFPLERIAELHDKVVECFFCPHNKLWKPMRLRTDKDNANPKFIVEQTIRLMENYVSLAMMENLLKK